LHGTSPRKNRQSVLREEKLAQGLVMLLHRD